MIAGTYLGAIADGDFTRLAYGSPDGRRIWLHWFAGPDEKPPIVWPWSPDVVLWRSVCVAADTGEILSDVHQVRPVEGRSNPSRIGQRRCSSRASSRAVEREARSAQALSLAWLDAGEKRRPSFRDA